MTLVPDGAVAAEGDRAGPQLCCAAETSSLVLVDTATIRTTRRKLHSSPCLSTLGCLILDAKGCDAAFQRVACQGSGFTG